MEIDETEEFERMNLLKQRETLIRGMGKNVKIKKSLVGKISLTLF